MGQRLGVDQARGRAMFKIRKEFLHAQMQFSLWLFLVVKFDLVRFHAVCNI